MVCTAHHVYQRCMGLGQVGKVLANVDQAHECCDQGDEYLDIANMHVAIFIVMHVVFMLRVHRGPVQKRPWASKPWT